MTCRCLIRLTLLLAATALAPVAAAVQVQDVARLKGSENSKLVGMGLVVGLSGTGDGGKFLPAMRPLAEIVKNLIDPNVVASELKDSKNVALVALTATVPDTGVREGDHIDVHVATIGPAKSLIGGRLFLIPMTGPLPGAPVFAFAEGPVIVEDKAIPTVGVVRNGAQLTRDIMTQYLDSYGRINLIINQPYASWPVANNVASLINGILAPDGPAIARAIDQKNVLITVPDYERPDPAAFIAQILQSYVDPAQIGGGAKVKINEKRKSIAIDAEVQISPVTVTIPGLTITTITPETPPTNTNPKVARDNFVALDPEKRGGTKLSALMEALNQLKVSDDDRITIIKELHRMGKLHAQLILE